MENISAVILKVESLIEAVAYSINMQKFWKHYIGNFLLVQWLRLCASNVGELGLISAKEFKIMQAIWPPEK